MAVQARDSMPVTQVDSAGNPAGDATAANQTALLAVLPDAYETVAASQTAQILGATGAVGDFLATITIIPGTTSPGAVSVTDGDGSAFTVFAGGASSVSSLVPFTIALPGKCVNSTTPGWKITTGANVTVWASGNFT